MFFMRELYFEELVYHWLGNFAWRVEITCTRDTKIEVIDCEFPLCVSLLCDVGLEFCCKFKSRIHDLCQVLN